MIWWWDYYLEPNNLYHHFRILSDFLKGTDWSGPQSVLIDDHDDDIRVMALKGEGRTNLWIQDKAATWQQIIEKGKKRRRFHNVNIHLEGLANGVYTVEWLNPWTGAKIASEKEHLSVPAGELQLTVPDFTRDVAARLLLQNTGNRD